MTIPVRRGHEVKAARGPGLRCKGWRQEAILRLLENNLENAEDPDNLVIYMSIARAASGLEELRPHRRHALYDARGPDLRRAIRQADRRLPRTEHDTARHHGQRQHRRRMEQRGEPPQARRQGSHHHARHDRGRLAIYRQPGDPAGHLRDLHGGGARAFRRYARRAAVVDLGLRRHERRAAAGRKARRRVDAGSGGRPGADRRGASPAAIATPRPTISTKRSRVACRPR